MAAAGRTPVVFIHGLSPRHAVEPLGRPFRRRGTTHGAGLAGRADTVEAPAHHRRGRGLGIDDVTGHYADRLAGLPGPPS